MTDAPEQQAESGARTRTRTAIIDAAIEALSHDSTASLSEIAERADVGRTTLHRYFPERSDLLRATARVALTRVDEAIARVEPDRGPLLDALRRVVDALLDHGPIVTFLYSDPVVLADTELWNETSEGDDNVLDALFARAADQLRPELPIAWISSTFWALLYSGWEAVKGGTMTRHEIIDAIMTTFTRGVLVDAAPE